MARINLSTENEVNDFLLDNPRWSPNGKAIVRELVLSNFAAAVGAINAIAVLAEKMDHHPDILLYSWNKLKITLTTHDSGGLTKNDFQLARQIDDLNY